jgi:disulfide bond formation protein DsbB
VIDGVDKALAALGVAGQVAAAVLLAAGLAAAAGVRAPLDAVRRLVWGYELWLAFVVAAVATGGSLYFSEIAHYAPCELCWFQRVCMYPLSITTLLAALANDHRVARYLLPLPAVGGCVSVYHLLVQHGVVEQTRACQVSAPGGCATRWIEEFGYVTIPALALTAFALVLAFLALAAFGGAELEAPARDATSPVAALPGSGVVRVAVLAAALAAVGAIGWTIGHYARTGNGSASPTESATSTGNGTLAAGLRVFASAGCGACHTLAAARSTGTVGPDLDRTTLGVEAIAATVAAGKGAMPPFAGQLTDTQIRDVAALVAAGAG